MANPGHRPRQSVLVAALGREIEEMIGADQDVETATIGGIGVKDFAHGALVEHAGARPLLAREALDELVVVKDLAAGLLLCGERDLIVGIEIAAERRHPFEVPAHATLESFNLGQRRPRHDDKRYVALRQLNDRTVEKLGEKRTVLTAGFATRTQHGVIDDQLAFAAEQIGERLFAGWGIEDVVLVYFLPRQFAAFAGGRVAGAAERFFLGQISLA